MGTFIPKMSAYSLVAVGVPKSVKRRARFAPQLLADGLSSGIVSDQCNLVHGAFDEGTDIDPFCNINSDKFDLLQQGVTPVSVDVTEPSPTE